jgi:hypothetical protein
MHMFRLVWYETNTNFKYDAECRHEYMGDRLSIWRLWYTLKREQGQKHIEVYNLEGTKQTPEHGLEGLVDYNL